MFKPYFKMGFPTISIYDSPIKNMTYIRFIFFALYRRKLNVFKICFTTATKTYIFESLFLYSNPSAYANAPAKEVFTFLREIKIKTHLNLFIIVFFFKIKKIINNKFMKRH